jgi:hypothetical protein
MYVSSATNNKIAEQMAFWKNFRPLGCDGNIGPRSTSFAPILALEKVNFEPAKYNR